MRVLKTLLATILVMAGLVGLGATVWIWQNQPEESQEESVELTITSLMLGLSGVSVGGWLLWQGRRQFLTQQAMTLQDQFYQLLEQTRGRVTVEQWVAASHLPKRLAQAYLKARAKELGANQQQDSQGTIHYQFPVGHLRPVEEQR